jgi:glycosyltransferase involved in cell wall biosynthesis
MTASLPPLLWRKFLDIPFVLHVQDLWPESITESSMIRTRIVGRMVKAALTPWLTFTYRSAAATIAIAPTMGEMLVKRGVSVEHLHVVLNWSSEEYQLASKATGARSGLVVTYAGNIGALQDLETIVQAAHRVQDLSGFRLVLVGSGTAEPGLKALVADLGAFSVEFRGRVDPTQMGEIYADSDFQIVSLKDLDIFRGTIPSKLQSSLLHGVPVITTVAGDASALVSENQLGLVAKPGDVDSVAAAFRDAYAMSEQDRSLMSHRARDFYDAHMGREAGVDAVERVLLDAAKTRPRSTK